MFKVKSIFSILILSLILASCSTNEITGRKQFLMFGPEKDVPMGVQAMDEIMKTQNVVTTGPLAERVRRLGLAIAAKSHRPDFPWNFIVIKSDQLNAFALPGGQSAVYTKMAAAFPNDNELAAVMGHEIAHAVLRHGAEQVSRGQAQNIFFGVVAAVADQTMEDKENTQSVLQLAAMATQIGVTLPHSRAMELEADHNGAIYMAKAGYDPRATVVLWRKMAEMHKGSQRPPKWFSTHPTETQRIRQLEENMAAYMVYYEASQKQR